MIAAASDMVVVSLRWREGAAPDDHHELFQVVTLRESKIVAMQDYRRRRRALSAIA